MLRAAQAERDYLTASAPRPARRLVFQTPEARAKSSMLRAAQAERDYLTASAPRPARRLVFQTPEARAKSSMLRAAQAERDYLTASAVAWLRDQIFRSHIFARSGRGAGGLTVIAFVVVEPDPLCEERVMRRIRLTDLLPATLGLGDNQIQIRSDVSGRCT